MIFLLCFRFLFYLSAYQAIDEEASCRQVFFPFPVVHVCFGIICLYFQGFNFVCCYACFLLNNNYFLLCCCSFFVEWKSFDFCFLSCLVLLLCIFSMANEVLLFFSYCSSHACFLFVLMHVKFLFSYVFGPFVVVHFLLNGKVLTFASLFYNFIDGLTFIRFL